jgi:mono/diheme cytochrome c family protein
MKRRAVIALALGGWMAALLSVQISASPPQSSPTPATTPVPIKSVVDTYCLSCHNDKLKTGGLSLEGVDAAHPAADAATWERVVTKLRAGAMPPPGRPRPDAKTYQAAASWLEGELDRAWLAAPNPGRISAVQRLNRTEYNNAIRDLLALDVDVRPLLPGDDTADGSFDNVAEVLNISTAHLERYLSVARQVTRLAVGLPPANPPVEAFDIPLHVLQDDRQSEDLPLGSRGGIAVRHTFPASGDFLIKVRLRRQYQDYIMGMGWPQQLDVRLDGKLLKRFTVGGGAKGRPAAASYAGDGEPGFAGDPEWEKYMQIDGDAGLEVRLPIEAGPHVVGVSFVREWWEPEGLPQPLQRGRVITNDQIYMDHAAVGSVEIGGPYEVSQAAVDTPSRRAVFVCQASRGSDERACATKILTRMARLAYRRPVSKADQQTLLGFFDRGRQETGGSFDTGIQFALERMLVDPDFLLRVHRDPAGPANRLRGGQEAGHYKLTDLEVASRLSFFLWNSIPDERLLDLAERGELTKPLVLERETRRMLADGRAVSALVDGFAAQWLNLRRVGEVVVHPDFYPNYDESLLEAFKTETEMFVGSTVREDRSVLDLLRANYTFANERLARHYGLKGIAGSRFRRVTLPDLDQRGGLLAHGSLLATTSYPDRTSPVLRGKWLLTNIFGVDVPQPPPGVNTSLEDPKPGALPASIRERLSRHRTSPTCASCHAVIDPMGFALEHYDAIGGWRTVDESGRAVDATGTTPSGAKVDGLASLRALLLAEPDQFPRTVTEKLLAYALGRRLEYSDRPAVRTIVRAAATHDYRWSAIVLGIVRSPTFLMRTHDGLRAQASGLRGRP